MKKIVIALLVVLFIVVACKDVSQENYVTSGSGSTGRYDLNISGMHYIIITGSDRGVGIINLTKDSLEVANLKSYEK